MNGYHFELCIVPLEFNFSQNIRKTENKKLKEELTNLRSDLKEKDVYLKNKLRILEDRSRRNNIRVEGIPGSENEGWDVTEEKLKKVIKDELDIENVVIERAHRVKRKSRKIRNFYFKEDFSKHFSNKKRTLE